MGVARGKLGRVEYHLIADGKNGALCVWGVSLRVGAKAGVGWWGRKAGRGGSEGILKILHTLVILNI